MRLKILAGALGATVLTLAGCAGLEGEFTRSKKVAPPHVIDGVTYLDQGWGDQQRQWYYYASQGSRLIPYKWFTALTDPATKQPLTASLAGLGYLPGTKGLDNPDLLPVGFVKDTGDRAGGDAEGYLGLTCAACHTADLKINGTVIRVDGAPATGELYGFITLIQRSLKNVTTDDTAFQAFALQVLGKDATPAAKLDLYNKVKAFLADYDGFVAASSTKVPWGYARTDAFGMIFNRVSAIDLHYPANNRSPAAPVSYPHLWSASQQPVVQWDGMVPNKNDFEALGRNSGEVLGVFGDADLKKPTPQYYAYASSVRASNLIDMEEQLRHLETPVWPESLLGTIDTVAAATGEKIYQKECVSCHALRPRGTPTNDPTPIVMTPLFKYNVDMTKAIGAICSKGVDAAVQAKQVTVTYASDPKAAVDGFCRNVDTRQLAGVKMPGGEALKQSDLAFNLLTNVVTGVALGKVIYEDPLLLVKLGIDQLTANLTDDDKKALVDPRTFAAGANVRNDASAKKIRGIFAKLKEKTNGGDQASAVQDPFAYKARPLDGIWATAPYMHNGSVPTLWELLLPVSKRSVTFPVGSGAFDAMTVGVDVKVPAPNGPAPGGYVFDTRQEGNANTGHEWGAQLADPERRALIEYLKTL